MDILFCPQCQNLLDLPGDESFITCAVCGEVQSSSRFEDREVVTRSRPTAFATTHNIAKTIGSGQGLTTEEEKEKERRSNEGARVKEKCPKCENPEMSFHTMQLRSADEGQTVFYVCPKCSYKYSVKT